MKKKRAYLYVSLLIFFSFNVLSEEEQVDIQWKYHCDGYTRKECEVRYGMVFLNSESNKLGKTGLACDSYQKCEELRYSTPGGEGLAGAINLGEAAMHLKVFQWQTSFLQESDIIHHRLLGKIIGDKGPESLQQMEVDITNEWNKFQKSQLDDLQTIYKARKDFDINDESTHSEELTFQKGSPEEMTITMKQLNLGDKTKRANGYARDISANALKRNNEILKKQIKYYKKYESKLKEFKAELSNMLQGVSESEFNILGKMMNAETTQEQQEIYNALTLEDKKFVVKKLRDTISPLGFFEGLFDSKNQKVYELLGVQPSTSVDFNAMAAYTHEIDEEDGKEADTVINLALDKTLILSAAGKRYYIMRNVKGTDDQLQDLDDKFKKINKEEAFYKAYFNARHGTDNLDFGVKTFLGDPLFLAGSGSDSTKAYFENYGHRRVGLPRWKSYKDRRFNKTEWWEMYHDYTRKMVLGVYRSLKDIDSYDKESIESTMGDVDEDARKRSLDSTTFWGSMVLPFPSECAKKSDNYNSLSDYCKDNAAINRMKQIAIAQLYSYSINWGGYRNDFIDDLMNDAKMIYTALENRYLKENDDGTNENNNPAVAGNSPGLPSNYSHQTIGQDVIPGMSDQVEARRGGSGAAKTKFIGGVGANLTGGQVANTSGVKKNSSLMGGQMKGLSLNQGAVKGPKRIASEELGLAKDKTSSETLLGETQDSSSAAKRKELAAATNSVISDLSNGAAAQANISQEEENQATPQASDKSPSAESIASSGSGSKSSLWSEGSSSRSSSGLDSYEAKRMVASAQEHAKEYQASEFDTLFKIVTKTYHRNLDKILMRQVASKKIKPIKDTKKLDSMLEQF